ncbi:hypothetical protein CP985_10005 [Malaciobacter mytili LMG 24559]|uniref:Phosphatidylserine decarboxylase n=1 Tax=Malaciobacter mytili LMG 24559 TaxID=1032238 RepID=A0AAX2AGI8_9BACT|nr:hypothetical protein [Malaciobacter mytili]AXH14173.1 phosphatidylserine decarboxylase family protein [Malaciobacter mytili LMG 24559]RXK15138.1 hypothetical protein CP985_10005 [Malaciobacter mytili LMG 24559]
MFDKYILKQGQKVVFSLFAFAIFFGLIDFEFISTLLFLIFILSLYIFRNKKIKVDNDALFISPVSGRIEAIDFNDTHKFIYINVSLFDESFFISPETSQIEVIEHRKGLNLSFDDRKSKDLNEKLHLKTENSQLELISSFSTNNISTLPQKNYQIGQFITLFTQGEVIIKIKKDFNLDLKIADRLKIGQVLLKK